MYSCMRWDVHMDKMKCTHVCNGTCVSEGGAYNRCVRGVFKAGTHVVCAYIRGNVCLGWVVCIVRVGNGVCENV